MRGQILGGAGLLLAATSLVFACGARSSLPIDGGTGGGAACTDGMTVACGSDVGACKKGRQTCKDGVLGPCEGSIGPTPETCNGIDDDCNGIVDDGFDIGKPCGGQFCPGAVMTCDGCSQGPNKVEVCNGKDDNCNGIIDTDCEVGDCQPTLEFQGSAPSSANCIDFPVDPGTKATLEYPCIGGAITAKLGNVAFTGNVANNYITLDAEVTLIGPDHCLWTTSHHIEGSMTEASLSYAYSEKIVPTPTNPIYCWWPCTEQGTVAVQWSM
jgi:hypothetical protein